MCSADPLEREDEGLGGVLAPPCSSRTCSMVRRRLLAVDETTGVPLAHWRCTVDALKARRAVRIMAVLEE